MTTQSRIPKDVQSQPQTRTRFDFRGIYPHTHLDPESMALFHYEARRLRYGRTLASLQQMTVKWVGLTVLGTVVFWLLVLIISGDRTRVQETMGSIISFLFVISLLDKFVYDFIGLTSGLDSIRTDYTGHRWPLIAVSDLSMNRLVAIKYIVVQVSAWRTMLLVVCLRLGVVTMAVLQAFMIPVLYGEAEFAGNDLSDLQGVVLLIVFALLAIIYVIEPRWRLRALSAASILNSLRGRDSAVGLMWSLPSFFRLWVTQILTGVVAFVSLQAPFAAASIFVPDDGTFSTFIATVFFILYVLAIGALIRFNYRGFASTRLRKVHQRLVADGGGL